MISDLKDALLVREESVYLDQGQEYLYIMDKDTAKRVAIKTSLRQNGKVQILEGIKAGDSVIYAGLHSIYPGAKVIVVEE